ncbi:MAG: flagellar hook-basal body complex protein FliE [Hyphomonadaceae bacterium]
MPVDPLSATRAYLDTLRSTTAPAAGAETGGAVDFGQLVQNAVREATQTSQIAEQQAVAVAAGRGDIVDVVTAIAAAETQLETVMAVRDQVIQAYQEILRMPI